MSSDRKKHGIRLENRCDKIISKNKILNYVTTYI